MENCRRGEEGDEMSGYNLPDDVDVCKCGGPMLYGAERCNFCESLLPKRDFNGRFCTALKEKEK